MLGTCHGFPYKLIRVEWRVLKAGVSQVGIEWHSGIVETTISSFLQLEPSVCAMSAAHGFYSGQVTNPL